MADSGSVNLILLTGPMLIANLVNWGLFGVLTVQIYIYYMSFPKDPSIRKWLVTGIYLLEIAEVILSTHDAFKLFASGWGNPAIVDDSGLLWLYVPILTGMIACASQMFYAWRVHAISRNRILTGIICMFSVLQLAFNFWDAVETKRQVLYSVWATTVIFKTTIVYLVFNAACDVTITMSMFYYLFRARKTSNFSHTSVMISRLIRLTVETGFVTAVNTIAGLIVFVVSKHSLLNAIFLGLTCKLYSNTLMAVLNARVRILGGRVTDETTAISMSTFEAASSATDSTATRGFKVRTGASQSQNGISIAISKSSQSDSHTVTMGTVDHFNSKSSASLAEPLPGMVYDRA